jgi:group II intron reverse transcriptase/maturase
VAIPKPDGGVRKLGIPTVLNRFIQQAAMQVLQRRWDRTFSEHSYGFRPGRSAHQAVAQAQQFIAEGHGWCVDLDLEKFFDRVNHDKVMGQIAKRVADKRLLKLIRAFLNAGVMENGLVSPSVEGTPQGGPLSPLLGNLVLDELDQELERRGHRFVRYADDCNIYVGSERAGQRVMESVTRFITQKLKLKVNEAKSAVARPQERKFLGLDSASRLVPRSSALSRPGPWIALSSDSGKSREGQRESAWKRRWMRWPRICGAGMAISDSAKRLKCSFTLPAGSGCDSGRPCGGSGKHGAVVGRLCWNSEYVRGWQATPPVAGSVTGTSLGPMLCLLGFPIPTSHR